MSDERKDTATITLPVESWTEVQAILLLEARRRVESGEREMARKILDDLLPEIEEEAPNGIVLGLACQIEEDMSDGGAVVGSIG